MNKIEHIGIAVKDINESKILFKKLLGQASYKTEDVPSEEVTTEFFKLGNTKIELVEGVNEESVINKFINKKGEGIHHIAFNVENIHKEIKRLKSEGFEFVNDIPKLGADNKLVIFIHPKTTNGILVEICQDIKNKQE